MPLTKLNQEQYKAATAAAGNNLIIASAGTGKTSTIVARIAHLLNLGVNPSKILLLTFTNKASSEMIERLQKHFSTTITSKITAGTFHSVSYKLLRELNKNIVLKQPSELKVLLKSLVERRKFHHISDVKPYGGAYLYDVYSLFQNKSVDGNFNNWFCQNYDEQSVYVEIYEDILQEFEDEKDKFGYVDFNDLLIKMKKELKKGAPIYFDEILVDEYQDTNSLQGSLIDAFNTKSLFCVGDFDQSIYAFNGANIEIIGSFKDRYKDANIYALNINYRSTKSILALANKVIQNNPRLYDKQLIVGRDEKPKPPKLLVFEELFAQYANIAKIIKESKYNHEDIAIIFRNNSSADGLEASLREFGIGAKRKGGVSFFESREIKALVNLMGIFVNPKDMMAFMQIFEYARGIGAATSKEIYDALISLGHGDLLKGLLHPDKDVKVFAPKTKNYQLGLFDEIDNIDSSSRFDSLGFKDDFLNHPALKYQKLSEESAILLYEIYNLFKKLLSLKTSNAIIKECINSKVFALITSSIATKKATMKNGKVDEELKKDFIIKIYQKCEILIDMSKKYRDIYSFYNFLTLGSGELSEGEGVNLLSIHASKGLEFGLVFIVDLAQKRFPNYKLMSMGGSLEEERRLFYVAVTRAKNELILSYAKYDKIRKISYEPSEFLIEAGMVK
ncbi:ATP-dependent DNA helicase [Campylobacter blaseri]|uniref:DNA 3'-5' helicase n=1 Tax=Campylobacter blaseri TaxID=2042961 RepID=A0A2P8QYR2_9BACT|nr:ATP-dependent helicase [Campylobacter blaseri]PSM51384.1 ATP-dependent DNA helicase [Campylobacter blaseri]PSM52834.1 ATP-dependent DNA helicase [Campylobacter blaseri]QKF86136.1 ATP-dependent DNA helicase [Campylobacter blaseri]